MHQFGRSAAIIVGGWTAMVLLFTPQIYLLNQRAPTPATWGVALLSNAITFYVWALLTPLVLWIGRKLPFVRGKRLRAVVLHVVAAFVLAYVHLLLVQVCQMALSGFSRPPRPISSLWVGYGATNVLIYVSLTGFSQALMHFRRAEERERRLSEAQLRALRAQLHPHFLFNTLGAIAELIHANPAKAEATLMQLSDLLRLAMADDQPQHVTLDEELEWLSRYLDIWRTLLDQRLTVVWHIDERTRPGVVPAMLLQPLIENAIRHAIAPRRDGGIVTIGAERAGDDLVLTVKDDGPGVQVVATHRPGVGLANVRARLSSLYGTKASLQLASAALAGTTVTVRLPWKEVTP